MFALHQRNARGYRPAIQIIIDGREVSGLFYSRLVKASIRDEAGQASDMVTLELDDARNELEMPRQKARIEINVGYRETGLRRKGIYELQTPKIKGGSDGELLILQAKAADLRRFLKGSALETFENTTYGDIARRLARRGGLEAVIDPTLDNIPVGFEIKIAGQSDIDFLTRLSDDHDAILKPAGGKMLAVKRGGDRSATGRLLPPLVINKRDCIEWEIEPDGRVEYSKVVASYVDQKTGKRVEEEYATGLGGPVLTLPDSYADEDKARVAAEAEGRRLNRNTGDGYFRLFGNPDAMAEQPVLAQGFRAEANGEWRAASVEDEFDEAGYVTTVNIRAREGGRKAKDEEP